VSRAPLKVAVVGCGKIADGHIGELQKMDDVRIVGVCDLEIIMAEQLAARFGIAHHTDDFARLLEEHRPDVVHITTPPQSHEPLMRQAMDAGAHVYCEKPLALDAATTGAMIEYALAKDRKLTVGQSFHFDPPALAMRRLLADGVIGDPVHVESWFGYNLSGPVGGANLADPGHWVHALPGKLFHNNVDHMLNKVLEFVTADDLRVDAFGMKRRPQTHGDHRDALLDELRVVMRAGGVTGYATFTSHVTPVSHFLRLYGTRGIIHADYNIRTVVVEHGVKLPSAIGRLLPAFQRGTEYRREGRNNVIRFLKSDFQFFAGMNHLMRRFYDAVRGDGELPITYPEMRRLADVMDEIWRQLDPARGVRS
jgi:predicted dehydrogenase